jgi:hypothetical protein
MTITKNLLFFSGALLLVPAAPLVIGVQQEEAYAQVAIFDEIDEDHQPLISEILNALQNQTADEIRIPENGQMIIRYHNAVTSIPPPPPSPSSAPPRPSILNNADSLGYFGETGPRGQDITIVIPHNFTTRNGYEYRDGTIYTPNGTELFMD